MTARRDLERELHAYLDAHATSRAPDGFLDVALVQVRSTRQRPGWRVPNRWLPASATGELQAALRVGARVAVVAILIAVTAVAVLIAGSQRRLPPPFGLARPGLLIYTQSDYQSQNATDHLYVMNVDGSGRRQLTFGPNLDFRPTWSLDGTLIAYWSYGPDGVALKVVSPDGQHEVTIADRLLPSVMDSISWAPDSRHLTFAGVAPPPLSPSRIYVAQPDRPGASVIGDTGLEGFEPAWSPNGRQIAFKNRGPADALWLMGADGSNPRRLTTTPGSGHAFENAQWSPDGTRLLVLAGDNGAHDVWVINSDGTGEQNITNSPEDESSPSWSPDGSKVAFVRTNAAGDGAFVVANPDGSDPLALKGPSVDGPPIWSPDASKLFGLEKDSNIGMVVSSVPPLGGHRAIVVYDPLGRMPPTVVSGGDDASWQRLAN